MSATAPRRSAIVIAGLSSAVIAVVAGIAVWQHQTGQQRNANSAQAAVIAPVMAAVEAASANSVQCAQLFTRITGGAADTADQAPTDAQMLAGEGCGMRARSLAEAGYVALDEAPAQPDSEGRAAFLDAAGSLLSVYELQGDDFDSIYDRIHAVQGDAAARTSLAGGIARTLDSAAPDIANGRDALERARRAYLSGD